MKNTIKKIGLYTESSLYVLVTLGVYSCIIRLFIHIISEDLKEVVSAGSISGILAIVLVVGFCTFCAIATGSLLIAEIKERHNA